MKKKTVVYLGKRVDDGYYELGMSNKGWTSSDGFVGKAYLSSFCSDLFEQVTGFSLRSRKPIPVTITIKPVKQERKKK